MPSIFPEAAPNLNIYQAGGRQMFFFLYCAEADITLRTLAHDVDAMEYYDAKWSDGYDYTPTSYLSRASVCSAGVISQIGVNAEGLASAVYVLEGAKYRVVAEPLPQFAAELALDQVSAFSRFLDYGVDKRFRWEGVMLTRGTVLYVSYSAIVNTSLTVRFF